MAPRAPAAPAAPVRLRHLRPGVQTAVLIHLVGPGRSADGAAMSARPASRSAGGEPDLPSAPAELAELAHDVITSVPSLTSVGRPDVRLMCVQLTADPKPTSRANRAAGVNTASKHQRCLHGENRMARPAHTHKAHATRHGTRSGGGDGGGGGGGRIDRCRGLRWLTSPVTGRLWVSDRLGTTRRLRRSRRKTRRGPSCRAVMAH